MHLIHAFVLVANVAFQQEWGGVKGGLEGALRRLHRRSHLWVVLCWHGLDPLSGDRFAWRILSEKFGVGHRRIIKGHMVVHWAVEVLTIGSMAGLVVFWAFDIEVWDPPELTINITIFWNFRIIWHPGALNLIHFIGVMLPFWLYKDWLFLLVGLIEVLPVVSVISLVEIRWALMEALVPLLVTRSQHSIICILLDN